MTLTRNGELVATGVGAAAFGDPVAVLAWLANILGHEGVALEGGPSRHDRSTPRGVSPDRG